MVQCNSGCPTPGDCDRLCSACHQLYSWQPPGQAFAVMRRKKKGQVRGKYGQKAGRCDDWRCKSVFGCGQEIGHDLRSNNFDLRHSHINCNTNGSGFQSHRSEKLTVLGGLAGHLRIIREKKWKQLPWYLGGWGIHVVQIRTPLSFIE